MRKSITLFDDQYAFYKELKSEKLLVAFVEFMFEDIEPQWLNSMEQVIRNSLLERMDNWKGKSDAWSKWWSKSHWGGRPKKQAEELQNNNNKTNKKQAKNNQVEDKDISRSISNKIEDKEIIKTNSNELVEQSSIVEEHWDKKINDLINLIKDQCNSLWIAYDKYKDRYFANFILTAKEFGAFAEKIWQNRVDFALNVLKASRQIKFRKWICSWPMKIYQNYSEVYNETLRQHSKQSKNLIQSF